MSLTSVLKSDRTLARSLADLVSVSGAPRPGDLPSVAPAETKHYQLVGTAFDYLFRFEVQRRNPNAKSTGWVASMAVELLKPDLSEEAGTARQWPGVPDPIGLANEGDDILKEARAAHLQYLRLRDPTTEQVAEVASHALRLAKLDFIYRAGFIDPDLKGVDPLDVRDLVRLCHAIPFEAAMSMCMGDGVWLNPRFGLFSVGIQGADADIVAGHALIDLKTSIKPDVGPHLAQIVGYSMLAEAYRKDGDPTFPEVESLGLYFSRQGTLVSFPMAPVRDHPGYAGAFAALMEHCTKEPITKIDLRHRLTARRPSTSGGPDA